MIPIIFYYDNKVKIREIQSNNNLANSCASGQCWNNTVTCSLSFSVCTMQRTRNKYQGMKNHFGDSKISPHMTSCHVRFNPCKVTLCKVKFNPCKVSIRGCVWERLHLVYGLQWGNTSKYLVKLLIWGEIQPMSGDFM